MKRFYSLLLATFVALSLFAQRGKIIVPNLNGFVTLKCDFHMHTIFSDGTVWPTVRVDEAYHEGLDVISITDHVEPRFRRPHIVATHNAAYELAKPRADARGIILIKGGELTRNMPPGHFNAIFMTDVDELDQTDYTTALRAARAQNAFIFWNHPGWRSQQPDTTLWWDEHTKLYEQDLMQGIEVANGSSYYPEAHLWAFEKNLTLIGVSDVHTPMPCLAPGEHRTMTFVFAREATAEGIREALDAQRTAVFHNNRVIGKEKYLKELFENALEWSMERAGNAVHFKVKNKSDLRFQLKKTNHDSNLDYFEELVIAPQSEQSFTVRLQNRARGGDVNFIVENFLTQPNQGMRYTVKIPAN